MGGLHLCIFSVPVFNDLRDACYSMAGGPGIFGKTIKASHKINITQSLPLRTHAYHYLRHRDADEMARNSPPISETVDSIFVTSNL